MKRLLLLILLFCASTLVYAQAPTYINGPTTIFAASGTVWYGDVTFGPNAVVYIEDGAAPIFFGKNMVVDPAATFISLPGNNQTGTGKIIFRDNNPLYPSYPLQQTLNGGFSSGANPSLLNIEIDNALGLSLTGNTRVTNTVLFTNGHIYLNNFNLVLDNDAVFANFNVSRHVVTNGTGVIIKEAVPNGASFLFPVSIAGTDYTPATVRNNTVTRNINVQVKNYSASAAIETIFATKGMDRTWQINSNIAGSANISLQHNTVSNANGTSTDESAFANTFAYVSQQATPGSWSTSCLGTTGGSPVSTHIGNNLVLPSSVSASAFFTKQSVSCVDLSVTKTVNNAIPIIGSNLTFTIVVENLSLVGATGVKLNDLLPSGYTYVSSNASVGTYDATLGLWDIGTLAYGGSATLTVIAKVNPTGNYANTATVTGNEFDPNLSNNTSTVTPVPGVLQANLKVVKTVNNATPLAGDNIVFTIAASNLGPSNATGVNVTDLLTSGYTYISSTVSTGTYNNATGIWTIGNFANGTNATLTITAKVNATGSYANTATIKGNELDPELGNNTSTITPVPVVIEANLKVSKTVNVATPLAGDNVVFTIVASNLGPNNATGVNVTDLLAAGYTYVSSTVSTGAYNNVSGIWTIGNLANGASGTLTITAKVNTTGSYVNTATIKGNESDPELGNNTSTVTPVPVLPSTFANLAVQKTVNNVTPIVGSNVVFTILASNMGPANATGVSVTDILPVGYTYVSSTASTGAFSNTNGIWTIGNLASGTSATLTITATVNAVGPYANTATIKGNEGDPELGNNTSTVTPVPTTGAVNLSIQKTATNAGINIGDTFDYTIVVRNIGSLTATEVIATDILPDGLTYISAIVTSGTTNYTTGTRTLTWNIGSLTVGATTTLTLKVRADKAGTIKNTATVIAKEVETTITDNTSIASNEIFNFKIPNVITPDGDGKNDTFKIPGLSGYSQSTLIIYNRWGNEVWHSTGANYRDEWTGEGLNEGTYYYVLRIKDKAGNWQTFTGWLTLLKDKL